MKRFLGPGIIFACTLSYFSLSMAQAPRTPQKEAIAESLFREGKRLMRKGEFQKACDKFSASHQIDPALGTLLNLAVCLEKEGKTASAWSKYSDVIARAKKTRDKSRESYALKRLKKIESKLLRATVVVAHPIPNLLVFLNGNVLPREAWGAAFPVDPGKHQLEARAKGKKSWSATMMVDVAHPNQQWKIPLLEEEQVIIAPPLLPTEEKEPSLVNKLSSSKDQAMKKKLFLGLSRKKWAYVSGGSGAALLLGGVVFDAMAVKAYNKAKNADNGPAYDDAKSKYRTRAIAANVLYGAGLVAVGVGAYLNFFSPSEDSSVGVTVTPNISGGGSLLLAGDF